MAAFDAYRAHHTEVVVPVLEVRARVLRELATLEQGFGPSDAEDSFQVFWPHPSLRQCSGCLMGRQLNIRVAYTLDMQCELSCGQAPRKQEWHDIFWRRLTLLCTQI